MTNEKETFYEECARILGVETQYKAPYHDYKWPNRWNNRAPGNGRFEGRGCVRMYSSTSIHIMLHSPKNISRTVGSADAAFEVLKKVMEDDTF